MRNLIFRDNVLGTMAHMQELLRSKRRSGEPMLIAQPSNTGLPIGAAGFAKVRNCDQNQVKVGPDCVQLPAQCVMICSNFSQYFQSRHLSWYEPASNQGQLNSPIWCVPGTTGPPRPLERRRPPKTGQVTRLPAAPRLQVAPGQRRRRSTCSPRAPTPCTSFEDWPRHAKAPPSRSTSMHWPPGSACRQASEAVDHLRCPPRP